jgi:hypothetical protein
MSPVIVPISPVVPAAPKAKGKPQQGPLSKHWSVTHNNYPAEWDAYTEEDFKSKVAKHYADHFHKKGLSLVYVCAGKEVAPTTGTRHMQMYLVFEDKRRATQLIKAYPALSYDISRGTPQQNEDYCSGECEKKGNERNPFFSTNGSLPKTGAQASKEMWGDIIKHAKAGNFDAIAESQPRVFLTQVKNLEHINRKYGEWASCFENPHEHRGIWIHSTASGVGKTSAVRRQWPNVYMKAHDRQWNDYNKEDVALLDDFSIQDAGNLAGELKNWCDHKQFQGRILYGTCKVHLKWFVVTSNYSIQDLFGAMGPEILGPILNRFRVFDWNDGKKWQDRDPACLDDAHIQSIPLIIQ